MVKLRKIKKQLNYLKKKLLINIRKKKLEEKQQSKGDTDQLDTP